MLPASSPQERQQFVDELDRTAYEASGGLEVTSQHVAELLSMNAYSMNAYSKPRLDLHGIILPVKQPQGCMYMQ